ncbi:MAG: hypothetical protein ACRDP1_12295 [Nocardioidaceae bacterium]
MEHAAWSEIRARLALGAVALAVALAATGCGGSGPGPTTTTTTSTTPTPSTTATSPTSSGTGATAEITTVYTQFFSGKSTAAEKIALVQNGPAFASTIQAQAGSPISKSTTATVSSVSMVTSTRAKVVYTVLLAGTPALKNQSGVAVNEGGHWKVGATTFCALLTLEGAAPALCSASTPTTK